MGSLALGIGANAAILGTLRAIFRGEIARSDADRHAIEISDQKRTFAADYLRVAEREVRSPWFRKRCRQFRSQCRDQPGRVERRQCVEWTPILRQPVNP